MKAPIGFLIVYGDGSRVLRLSVPRFLLYGLLAVIVLVGATVTAGQYVFVRIQAGELSALREEVSDHRSSLNTFQQRLTAVRTEIDGWRELHARMWESYEAKAGAEPEKEETDAAPTDAAPTDAAPADAAPVSPRIERAAMTYGPLSIDRELDLLATSINEESPRLKELERVTSRTARIMASLPLTWPARGAINSEFGMRKDPFDGAREHHGGIDIDVPLGGPVTAPAAGVVAAAGRVRDYGNFITIDHGNDVRSLYGHLSSISVRTGDHVDKGEVIGRAGSTGRSTGPHLHYEVRVNGRAVNPRDFLWE